MKFIHTPPGSGPCVKQVVKATVISRSGNEFVATNHCDTPQQKCPRADMPTGVGYHLCREVCNQPGHAEVNALALAARWGADVVGGTLIVEGHTYACDSCKAFARQAGIARLVVNGKEAPL